MNPLIMKPIETRYRGFRFRSRTEARWAVFMDALDVRFEYEKEAYELDGLCYLPDFWLPDLGAHLEIKPVEPTDLEQEKISRLVIHTQTLAYLFSGNPEVPDTSKKTNSSGNWPGQGMLYECVWDNGRACASTDGHREWCVCQECGFAGIEYDGRVERLACGCLKKYLDAGMQYSNNDSPKLIAAYTKAKSYQFEPSANRRRAP